MLVCNFYVVLLLKFKTFEEISSGNHVAIPEKTILDTHFNITNTSSEKHES